MTSAQTLTEEQVDDLLYCARAGETEDMVAYLNELAEKVSGGEEAKGKAKREIIEKVLDSSENGMLHYACANGHLHTLNLLLPYTRLTTLLHQNSSGNTPLHWAGLNGHLATVKALVAKIEEAEQADPSEAEAIRAVNRRRDAEARENKKRKQAEEEEKRKRESAAADGAESQESTSASTAAAETNHEDSEADRSIWDIRNKFGRGPTSESQLNDQEAVVQYLLTAMAGGGGEAGKAGQGSSSISASASTEEITQKAEQLKVEEKS